MKNVYDIVDEDEYSEIVRDRQDDDWIVDDGKFTLIAQSLWDGIFSQRTTCS